MAETKKATYKRYNGTDWDTIYFATSYDQIGLPVDSDGNATATWVSTLGTTKKLKDDALITTFDADNIRFGDIGNITIEDAINGLSKINWSVAKSVSNPGMLFTSPGGATHTYEISGSGATTVSSDAEGNITINTPALAVATSNTLGGIKIGYAASGKNYPVQLNSNNQAFVNVPWTDNNTNTAHSHTAGAGLSVSGSGGISGTTTYSLKTATSSEIGGIAIGAGDSNGMRGVKLNNSNQAYVNVPVYSVGSSSSNFNISVNGTNVAIGHGAAAEKGVVTTLDTSANLPTSAAVKTYVDNQAHIKLEKYDSFSDLPKTGVIGTIYLVPDTHSDSNDAYDEYIWNTTLTTPTYEKIGNTDVELTNLPYVNAFSSDFDSDYITVFGTKGDGTKVSFNIPAATVSRIGLMSAADKSKLDGLSAHSVALTTANNKVTLTDNGADKGHVTFAGGNNINVSTSGTTVTIAADLSKCVDVSSDQTIDGTKIFLNAILGNPVAGPAIWFDSTSSALKFQDASAGATTVTNTLNFPSSFTTQASTESIETIATENSSLDATSTTSHGVKTQLSGTIGSHSISTTVTPGTVTSGNDSVVTGGEVYNKISNFVKQGSDWVSGKLVVASADHTVATEYRVTSSGEITPDAAKTGFIPTNLAVFQTFEARATKIYYADSTSTVTNMIAGDICIEY